MDVLDIPPAAKENDNYSQVTTNNDYESQKKICLEAIAKIKNNCASNSVIFHSEPNLTLIKEIEVKGYKINYTLDYDSSREHAYMCKLRITNPNLNDTGSAFLSAFEDNMKKIGFNSSSLDTEESFKKLFNNIMQL